MNHESITAYCESLPEVETTAPFGPDSVVYKVCDKMFALVSLGLPRINLKCDPEKAVQLREAHVAVEPGYHMSKRHWNSVFWEREHLSPKLIEEWIRDSYALVVGSLKKADRERLSKHSGS